MHDTLSLSSRSVSWLAALLGVASVACEVQPATGVRIEATPPTLRLSHRTRGDLAFGKTVYVPVYSSIYRIHSKTYDHTEDLIAATSVRNVEFEDPIFILEARYYNSRGEVVRDYLDGVYELGPMATADFVVPFRDKSGGTGANFIIKWAAAREGIADPIIETVMLGQMGNAGVSLISRGHTTRSWTQGSTETLP